MRALQQINAMTMCSAADESGLSSSFLRDGEMLGFPVQRDEDEEGGGHRVTCFAEFILLLMFSPRRIKDLQKEKTK